MNRRGDVEIVINTRILERSVWLLVIVALSITVWWQWDSQMATSDATLQERVATLENQLSERDARITSLEAEKVVPTAGNQAVGAPVASPTPAPNATIAPTAPVASVTSQSGVLDIRWTQAGSYPSTGKYKLNDVEISITNGRADPVPLSYALCWSSIECEQVVARGSFTAKASAVTEHPVSLTIPTFVDVSRGQRLRLIVLNSDSKSEVFREEITIR